MLNDAEKQEESRSIIREIRSVAKEILVLPDTGQDSRSPSADGGEDIISATTNTSAGSSERPGALKIRFRQLLHFPRPDGLHLSRNLWSFVKAIVHLSQPRPIDANVWSLNPPPGMPFNFRKSSR